LKYFCGSGFPAAISRSQDFNVFNDFNGFNDLPLTADT